MSWEDGVFKTPEDIRAYGDERVLAERERIITLLEEMNCHGNTAIQCDCGSYSEAIALIKGENK